MAQGQQEARTAFGFLFFCVALAVSAGAVISELAYLASAELYVYAIIWLASFGAVFGGAYPKFRKVGSSIKRRMKGSANWGLGAKSLNAVCWAGPFLAIPVFPALYQYLILVGIGLGNLSTYLMIKRFNHSDNREQLVVASVSLASIPVALVIDTTIFAASQDIAVMLSRILIAASYAAGGIFAYSGSTGTATQQLNH
ncbi:MAG TPA: hypothetical protein VJL54_01625 [Nitrososphaera sp.]|nr:hypothetical protein [Nitrososphaera sp.]